MQDILRCPVTKLGLRAMTDEQLNQLNRRVLNNDLRHLDGTSVQRPLTQALESEDGRFAYIIEDDIAMLLAAFAIVLRPGSEDQPGQYQLREEKQVVKDWYDQFGWQTGAGGLCLDALAFGDYRPVSQEYGHKTQLRPLKYLQQGGQYILDVASGAIPQPEYLQYSEAFEKRICIDLSFVALQQAKKKLGNRGIYILGDITNLPLRDDVCDAVISLHTIYHVPADEQLNALQELYRVLKPGGTELMIYNWGNHSFLVRLADIPLNPVVLNVLHRVERALGMRREVDHTAQPSLPPRPARRLYFHAHTYKWFKKELGRFCRFDVVCWRAVDQKFLLYYIRPRLFGRTVLKVIYWWEEKFSYAAARLGKFPMFIIHKPTESGAHTNHGLVSSDSAAQSAEFEAKV
jgi:ubiquinone/menaquinone biosynthesis C-methylase UbiE